jgi:hypothetical protein
VVVRRSLITFEVPRTRRRDGISTTRRATARTGHLYPRTPFSERFPSISPDGRWIPIARTNRDSPRSTCRASPGRGTSTGSPPRAGNLALATGRAGALVLQSRWAHGDEHQHRDGRDVRFSPPKALFRPRRAPRRVPDRLDFQRLLVPLPSSDSPRFDHGGAQLGPRACPSAERAAIVARLPQRSSTVPRTIAGRSDLTSCRMGIGLV